jgi:hypothetical protein
VFYKIQKKFSEDTTQNWNEGLELLRLGRFYRYDLSVQIIKFIDTTKLGSEKPLRAHWPDQERSPV